MSIKITPTPLGKCKICREMRLQPVFSMSAGSFKGSSILKKWREKNKPE
jgi:hypothetical protein